jgi:tRNA modification GTPase
MTSTIAAIATAGGVGSIAIVRLSGTSSLEIARKVAPQADFVPRQTDLTSLFDVDGVLIDRAIVIYFQSPKSFTGEDVVEFQCHGGRVVADEILSALTAHGARLAEPGEFSKRAFLNGKIDLSEAEAIAKLIEAKSVDAARILARQLKGGLGDFVSDVREKLLRALAHSEVMIDYAEDVPEDITDGLIAQLNDLVSQMERTVDSSLRRRGLIDGFRVAIIGKPNVGKSSLLNALLDYDRAIVSEIAGTTRDTIEEQVRIGSHIIRLIDTAGIRDSSDQIEQIGVKRSLSSVEDADIVIALFDASQPFDDEDARIVELLHDAKDTEQIVVLNKIDLERAFDIELIAHSSVLEMSANADVQPLIAWLTLSLDNMGKGDEVMLVSARQVEATKACRNAAKAALKPLEQGELELFSYYLNDAVGHISSITYPYENEEILDKMFGEFCLGK